MSLDPSHSRRRSAPTDVLNNLVTPGASSSTSAVPSPHGIPPVVVNDDPAFDHAPTRDRLGNATSVLDRLSSTQPSPHTSSSSSLARLFAFPSPGFALGRRRRVYFQLLALLVLGVWVSFGWPRAEHVPSSSTMRFHEKTSYLLGLSTCPSPDRPHFPVDQAISGRSQSCSTVPSSDKNFEIEVCPVKTTCNSFSVRIRRTNKSECARLESLPPPVDDESLGTWLKENKGPDSFMLRTNGAQRWLSEMSVYEGDCTYRFDVTLSNGGQVWLELWWLYTEYAYFNEQSKAWPENHFSPLFSNPVRLDICPDRCPMHYAPRLRESGPSSPLAGLPECPLEERVDGLWFPRHPMDVVDPPVPVIPPREGIPPLMGTYEYFHPHCAFRHRGKQFDFDRQACTSKPKKVLFAGDSHGRYVMFHFKHRLDNHTEYFQEMMTSHGPFHYDYDKLTLDFLWSARDEYLQFDFSKLGDYDGVLYSFGAWELMAGTRVQVFRQKLEDFFEKLSKAQSASGPKTRHNVFLVPPPIPPRLDGPARDHADQRTNHRFAAMRDISLDLCEKYGWRVVDEFDIGAPVVLEINAVDGGHLSPGPAHSPIVDEVVAKLGLC